MPLSSAMPNLIKPDYFKAWKSMLEVDIQKAFSEIVNMELAPHSFTFYTSVSVMSSSRIEGEQLDIDSYAKHKVLNTKYLPELVEKPNDLYRAYLFAKDNKLTKANFQKAYKLIAAHLLPAQQRGTVRKNEMLILEHDTGRIQFEAAPASEVKGLFDVFWNELDALLLAELTIEEVFYFASFIHLSFVHIHPYEDGNGRASRLLEKWFLAEKLGERAWYVKSEKYYYRNVDDYYKNLGRLGLFYEQLDYEKSIPFLLMLPNSLVFE